MKTYRVNASYVSYCHAYVQAESKEQAYELAKQMDGGDFEPDPFGGDWTIDQVYEVEATK